MLNHDFSVAEITISYKPHFKASHRPKISTSNHSEKIFRSCWDDDINLYESAFLLMVNSGNNVLGVIKIGTGGVDSCVIDIFKVLQISLACNSKGIIVAHNHPGGTLKPSDADITLTKRLFEAAKIMQIRLLDHLILTEDSYYSFADECLI